MGRVRGFQGELTIGGVPVPDIAEDSLMANITYVGHQSYLFRGTVRDVLKMGSTKATDADFWHVLEQVKLADFLRDQQGLDTELVENGINFPADSASVWQLPGRCSTARPSISLTRLPPISI